MSVARGLIERQFPNLPKGEFDKHAHTIAQIDEQLEFMYEGMVGQIYMYGRKIVSDPGKSKIFFWEASDVARLFLARGLKAVDETVIPYDEQNPRIQVALAQLADEVKTIFYPRMLAPEQVTKHFEKQKATILRFLEENSEPFPEGRFFSELIARRYYENILPLNPMDMYGKPAPDYLAVMHRHAFDEMRKVLGPILEAIDATATAEPDPRTGKTQPTNTKATSTANGSIGGGPTG